MYSSSFSILSINCVLSWKQSTDLCPDIWQTEYIPDIKISVYTSHQVNRNTQYDVLNYVLTAFYFWMFGISIHQVW